MASVPAVGSSLRALSFCSAPTPIEGLLDLRFSCGLQLQALPVGGTAALQVVEEAVPGRIGLLLQRCPFGLSYSHLGGTWASGYVGLK